MPDHAIADLSGAVHFDPNDTAANKGQGYASNANVDYGRADEKDTKELERDTTDAVAYTNRGLAYIGECEYERAIAEFEKAFELNPGWIETIELDPSPKEAFERDLMQAVAGIIPSKAYAEQVALDELDEQSEALLSGRYDQYSTDLYYIERGEIYFDNGYFGRAAHYYTEALRIDPEAVGAYCSRADAYRMEGEVELAIGDYNRAIALDPTDAISYVFRGEAYLSWASNVEGPLQAYCLYRALADSTKAVALDSKNNLVLQFMSDCRRAIADYTEAIGLDPKADFR